jgi:hypothetical protein
MNPIDKITPVGVNPSIPPSNDTKMNNGSLLKNSAILVMGIITAPQIIIRRTLGREVFTSPLNEPRRMVGMTMRTNAITNVRFLFLSENITDQLIEEGCERRNRNAQIMILILIRRSMR